MGQNEPIFGISCCGCHVVPHRLCSLVPQQHSLWRQIGRLHTIAMIKRGWNGSAVVLAAGHLWGASARMSATGRVRQVSGMRGEHCVVCTRVELGDGTRMGNFVLIRSDTRVGCDCVLGSNVDIEGNVTIGDRVSLQSFCYITRGVVIEDDVFCGPRVTTMNDKRMSYRREQIPFVNAAPRILRAARVGGASVLLPGVTVGENALVGAGSVVTRDVPDGRIVVGNPATIVGRVPQEELL